MTDATAPFKISVLVTRHFNAAATMNCLDAFRAANYVRGHSLYTWDIWSEHGGRCPASNGTTLHTKPIQDMPVTRDGMLLVSSSWTPEAYATSEILGFIRKMARAGNMLASLDTGIFLLAEAGELHGHRATCHYEHIDAFQENYPNVDVREDIMVFDRRIASCAGGSASLDFGLLLVRQKHGDNLANAAAKYLCHDHIRRPGTRQADARSEPLGAGAPAKVRLSIAMMEDHLETPLSLPELCKRAGISQRQLDRLFKLHVGASPAQYYRNIRLDRARGLVTQTQMSMTQVALASGFGSQDHFSRAYKARFGLPPSRDRVEGRVPFEFRAWPMYRAAPSR